MIVVVENKNSKLCFIGMILMKMMMITSQAPYKHVCLYIFVLSLSFSLVFLDTNCLFLCFCHKDFN